VNYPSLSEGASSFIKSTNVVFFREALISVVPTVLIRLSIVCLVIAYDIINYC
jgi:hypothetical protein